MYPSRNALEIYTPYTLIISDQYGESITLSRNEMAGDVLSLAVNAYSEVTGEISSVTLSGNFHNEQKQNAVNQLKRLQFMQQRSEQEHQTLLMIVPHPQIEIRGYIKNLQGPTWASDPHPLFYNYSFDFIATEVPRQPMAFSNPAEVILEEGKDYILVTIPSGMEKLRDLAYNFYGKSFRDGSKIRKIIELNNLTIAEANALVAGSVLKMPIN